MDQIRIGKFIADCRKKQNLTQEQLSEKLNITYKAVSKWECGKSLPDASIMLDLCSILKISVNELLSGQIIKMNNYNEFAEKKLLEMAKKEEIQNKRLFMAMWIIGIISIIFYFSTILLISYTLKEGALFNTILVITTIFFVIIIFIALKFEVDAGYYECKSCHYKFIPTYKKVVFSTHIGTTRHLQCPKCHKKTWAKKSMSK